MTDPKPLTRIPYGDEHDWTPPPGTFTPHSRDCLVCHGAGWRSVFVHNDGLLWAEQCPGIPTSDPIAAAFATGDRVEIMRVLHDLTNIHMLWAEILGNRARRIKATDPDFAAYLRSKKQDFDVAPELFIAQLPGYRVGLSDGRQVEVSANDEAEAKAKALRKAHRRGPLGIFGRKPVTAHVVDIAQVA